MSARRQPTVNASRVFRPGLRRFASPEQLAHVRRAIGAVLALGVLAGCAAAGSSTVHRGAAPNPPRISSSVRTEEAAIHRAVLASLHHESNGRYGGIPGDLRNKQAPPGNQLLSASAAHPAIAIQGSGVVLHLAHGSALATVVGPDIPDRIQGSADLQTPATWDLTFADVRGTIPISPSLFTITDEQGALLSPRVTVVGGGPLPETVPAGRPFTLQLKTVVSIGDGKLRYSPSGSAWLAEWDFDVETD